MSNDRRKKYKVQEYEETWLESLMCSINTDLFDGICGVEDGARSSDSEASEGYSSDEYDEDDGQIVHKRTRDYSLYKKNGEVDLSGELVTDTPRLLLLLLPFYCLRVPSIVYSNAKEE